MSASDSDAIEHLLSGLFSADQQTALDRVDALLTEPAMADVVDAITRLNPEYFDLLFALPLRECSQTLVEHCLPASVVDKPRLLFLFCHADFLESHWQRLFQQYEGAERANDKSRVMLQALAAFFASGEPIIFDYNQPDISHLPTKIFTQHQTIYEFYEALYRLYHGQPELYLQALGTLLDTQPDATP